MSLAVGLTVAWVAGLYFSLLFYLLFQLEEEGIFGTRRGPMDPAFTAFTVAGMLAGVAVPAAVSWAVLRSWRHLLIVGVAGVAVFAAAVLLIFPGLVWS